jgi:hypothetical protein
LSVTRRFFDDDTVGRVPISLPLPSNFGPGRIPFDIRGCAFRRKTFNAMWAPWHGPFLETPAALARLDVGFPRDADFLLRWTARGQLRSAGTTIPRPIQKHRCRPAFIAVGVRTITESRMDEIVAERLSTGFTLSSVEFPHRLQRLLELRSQPTPD